MSTSADFVFPSDWRGQVLKKISQLIHQADPEITEEVKYRTASNPNGVLVWYKNGMITTGEIYKAHLRLTFTKGPALKDHDLKNLLSAYRAIIIHEDDQIDETAFKDLILAAVALNQPASSF